MSRLQDAIDQVVFARNYTLGLLEQTPPADWYRQPPGCVSHVAWQVGHIAYSQYRMALLRIRGQMPQDEGLFPQEFLKLFGPDSVPNSEPANQLSTDIIRAVLNRVHDQVLLELPSLDEAALDQSVMLPHPLAKTKFLALMWCGNHEMLHGGQIGLLRRLLGYPPIW